MQILHFTVSSSILSKLLQTELTDLGGILKLRSESSLIAHATIELRYVNEPRLRDKQHSSLSICNKALSLVRFFLLRPPEEIKKTKQNRPIIFGISKGAALFVTLSRPSSGIATSLSVCANNERPHNKALEAGHLSAS